MIHGDFGRSFATKKSTFETILARAPVTIELTVLSMLWACAIGISTGIISAVKRNTRIDHIVRVVSLLGVSIPYFLLGLILLIVFGVYLRALPIGGHVPFFENPVENLRHMILPSFSLGFAASTLLSRMTRAMMLEVLSMDHIRTARGKGLSSWKVIRSHALKNTMIPLVTIIGFQTAYFLGGAVIVEQIFSLPGIGRLLVLAVHNRDYQVVQAIVLILALTFVIANLVVDLLYFALNPRIERK